MRIFQVPYDAIKRFRCRWFCIFMGILQNQVIWPAIQAVGDAGKMYIIMKIEEAALKDIPGPDKMKFVFNAAREKFTVDNISDDFLTNLIQNLYSTWKIGE